jgi:hypothetical protein
LKVTIFLFKILAEDRMNMSKTCIRHEISVFLTVIMWKIKSNKKSFNIQNNNYVHFALKEN